MAQTHCGVQAQPFEFLKGCRLISKTSPYPRQSSGGSNSPLQGPPLQEPGRGVATGEVCGDLWGCFLRTRSLRTAALRSQELLGRPSACPGLLSASPAGGAQGGAGSMRGCGRRRQTGGEAGLIYGQSVMGPLGKVGTHDRPLEIRAHKYVSDVNGEGEGHPNSQYQPETWRPVQDEAAILDRRKRQDLPWLDRALPSSRSGPLFLPHIATSSPRLTLPLPWRSYFITELCPTGRSLSRQTCSGMFPEFLILSVIN